MKKNESTNEPLFHKNESLLQKNDSLNDSLLTNGAISLI